MPVNNPIPERSIWVQPHRVVGTNAVLASSYDRYASSLLANNEDDYAYFTVAIPTGFTAITKAVIALIPLATGNLRLYAWTRFAANGEAYDKHGATIAEASIAVTAGEIKEYDISSALSGLLAGDYLGVFFTRSGSNILDRSEGDLHVLGLLIEYV